MRLGSRCGHWMARVAALAFLALGAAIADARQVPPNYSWNFATVTHPGNRVPNQQEVGGIGYPLFPIGRVDYSYRIATTEVTGSQWQEFLNAYAPYIGDQYYSRAVWGLSNFTGFSNGVPQYRLNEGAENLPVNVGWRFAARFVNWLNNGKALTRAAFESGAYDTSTFGPPDPKGFFPDQRDHTPGARYWIPTMDEWVKAVYYDPNKYGPGQEGYWRYPVSQDTPPVYGLPGTPGAQSAAGVLTAPFTPPVGAYPNAISPWGLLDASGGATEWTESTGGLDRVAMGSSNFTPGIVPWQDALGAYLSGSPEGITYGIRVASAVPGPGAGVVLGLFLVVSFRRRRSSCVCLPAS